MLIKKSETKKHVNSPVCIAYAYNHKDKKISIAFIKIRGRYPDEGTVMNKICKELIFVINGRGIILVDGKRFSINANDSILIQPNKKYFIDGKLDTIVCSQPAWHLKQHIKCD